MLEFELVLPCYNESKTLEILVTRAKQTAIQYGFDSTQFQLVLVENGSKDDSQAQMTKLQSHPELKEWFRIVEVKENKGYGFGLFSGLKTCSAPFVGYSHADMQCDPKDAFLALKKLKESDQENMIVKGVRFGRNWKDVFVSRVFEFLTWIILGKAIYEINAQPKVFCIKALSLIKNPPSNFAFDLYFLYSLLTQGYMLQTIPVEFPPRIHGVSNWASNFFSRYKTILMMIRYMFELRSHRAK